jgi:Concanavalin A-like lectin/glucanases superfamily
VITRRFFLGTAVLALAPCCVQGRAEESVREPTVWRIDAAKEIGGHATEVIGKPRVVEGAVVFDGENDGLLVSVNPLAGLTAWTVEVLIKPDEDGPAEQRFWHAQDAAGSRALLETRLNGAGGWWLDTYLMKAGNTGLPLIDPKKIHRTNAWHWVALRYDGKTMTHFVNGEKEREGAVDFGPMGAGKISLGVRQNRVHWFKGAMREVRVTPMALAEDKLQRAQ